MTTFSYIILIIWVSVLIGLAQTFHQNKKRVRLGTILLAGALSINIIYTKMLGWHMVAHSPLEWTLDILDGIPMYIGSYLLVTELQRHVKKETASKGRF